MLRDSVILVSHGGTLWTRTLAAIPVGHVRTGISIGPVRGLGDFTSFPSFPSFPKDLGTITVYYQMNRRIKEYRYSKPGTAHLVTYTVCSATPVVNRCYYNTYKTRLVSC